MTQTKRGFARIDKVSASADLSTPALYVNYFEVGHNPFEFLMDLGQYHPGSSESDGRVAIHTRIATAPPVAKMLSDLLARAVEEHESQHGEIAPIGPQDNPFDILLSSLGDFEERARALRERDRAADPDAGSRRAPISDNAVKPPRARKGK
ncbi:DUF3467 domain-containing protein [Rhizobacter sp. Root1221]|uniref:DUF3467 domain-containing protein n=1 Tax=Rhizobacter sp. Root1221 TaxID=1736433 RepID=UPI0006F300C9|nr:DUF3467 domain-containing protein [Rhizobacter sp. Root1221]KQW01525.1 hypothetical protein ASC87_14395 [Rhizobacter sp. Root1221]